MSSNNEIHADNSSTSDIHQNFTLFSLFWAIAILVHQLRTGLALTPAGVVLFMVAWWVILNPRALKMFILLICVQIVEMWLKMPYPSNHSLLITFVNLTILLTIGRLLIARRPISSTSIWSAAIPAIRLETIMLYFWAAIHKLNYDFFNPLVSCATTHKGLGHYPFLPQPAWLQWATIYGTVLTEASLVLLLSFRRTRPYGVLLGLGLHYLLGLFDFHDFSTVMMTLLLLFASHESGAIFTKGQYWLSRTQWRSYWLFPIILISTFFAFRAPIVTWTNYSRLSIIFEFIWAIITLIPIVWFMQALWTNLVNAYSKPSKNFFNCGYITIYLLPILVFFNGLTPYLGLKTEVAFSMYSNLKTEGNKTNHLFIPTSWQIWDYQRDLVQILDSDAASLSNYSTNDYLLPYALFQAIVSHSSPTFITYERQGTITKLVPPIELLPNRPSWIYKFFHFRPVDAQSRIRCTH
jgi:hypothetical protein